MSATSAGLLLYRVQKGNLEVLLVHPGGPLWARKDIGAWSVPKGLIDEGEDPLEAARREFHEETGFVANGPFLPLTPVKLRSGKTVIAWAAKGDCDPGRARSNTFTMEWPPHSGKRQAFPEADRAAWFATDEAARKINPGQAALIEELRRIITAS
ncbi:MAG TPA: NUDIX domain-containing protein [Nitrospirota bacterium]